MLNPLLSQPARAVVLSACLGCLSALCVAETGDPADALHAILSGDYHSAREQAGALESDAASPLERLGNNLAALSRDQLTEKEMAGIKDSCLRISNDPAAGTTVRAAARFLLGRIAAEMEATPHYGEAQAIFRSLIADFPDALPAEHAKVELCLLHVLQASSVQAALVELPYAPADITDKHARRNLHMALAQLALKAKEWGLAGEHLAAALQSGVGNRSIRGNLILSYANLAYESNDMPAAANAYRTFLSENAGDGRSAAVKARLDQISGPAPAP